MKLPKFGLRDLLWFALVAAMGFGWWGEHRAKLRQEAAGRKYLSELGAEMAQMSMELTELRGVKPLVP